MAPPPHLVQQPSFSFAKPTAGGSSTDSCHSFWLHHELKPAMMVQQGWAHNAWPKQLLWQLLLCSGRKDQVRAQGVCAALYPRRGGEIFASVVLASRGVWCVKAVRFLIQTFPYSTRTHAGAFLPRTVRGASLAHTTWGENVSIVQLTCSQQGAAQGPQRNGYPLDTQWRLLQHSPCREPSLQLQAGMLQRNKSDA